MKMFDNYDNPSELSKYLPPDNQHSFCLIDETDEIVRGATCYHIFILPFKWSEVATTETKDTENPINKVSYLNGIHVILEKYQALDEFDIQESDNETIIRTKLTPQESLLFQSSRETKAQLKVLMNNDDIIYSKSVKIKVRDSVDNI